MNNRLILTHEAPAPIGPYSQAVWAGDLLFVSGQIPICAADGTLVQGSVADETRQVMQNLQAILHTAGLSFQHVVKATIFLKDMDDFSIVNQVYGSYFQQHYYPARETVEVARLPKNVRVEISVIACRNI
ncbi:MAG: RidA family protein [Sphingobacteriales bacterium]|nr:RidA family protein [Sphingobacteriales bacterium]